MAVGSKNFPAEASAIPPARKFWSLALPAAYRQYFVWAQIIIVFLFLELALWAPTRDIRNRWAVMAMITILVLLQ